MAVTSWSRIGFVQGRLSPQIDGRIQAFPWPSWRDEFPLAESLGLSMMEWTLDAERLAENPLMSCEGRREIEDLMAAHALRIPTLTGDCFMHEPFWKSTGVQLDERLKTCEKVLVACGNLGVKLVVMPLVDSGSIGSPEERDRFQQGIDRLVPLLRQLGLLLGIESDLHPEEQLRLIMPFPAECVQVNYDMGNSASLGWDAVEEIALLGGRIGNVHVKDRLRGGGTVPLGQGAVRFPDVFASLAKAGYAGNLILQTARAADGEHVESLRRYAIFVEMLLERRT